MTSLNALIARIIMSLTREPVAFEVPLLEADEVLFGVEYDEGEYGEGALIDFIIER
jgi:hypothetical protein